MDNLIGKSKRIILTCIVVLMAMMFACTNAHAAYLVVRYNVNGGGIPENPHKHSATVNSYSSPTATATAVSYFKAATTTSNVTASATSGGTYSAYGSRKSFSAVSEVVNLTDNTTMGVSRTGYHLVNDKEWRAGSATGNICSQNGDSASSNKATVTRLGQSSVANATKTVYANWAANTYTVVFNASGGSGTMANQTHTYGSSLALTTNSFTKTGYTFAGWATSSTATTATYTNGQSVSNLTTTNGGTVNLYAVWTANSYTATLNPNSGTYNGSTSTTTKTMTFGSTTNNSIGSATRTGYTFNGWYDATSGGNQAWNAYGNSVIGTYWGTAVSVSDYEDYGYGTYNSSYYFYGEDTTMGANDWWTNYYLYQYQSGTWVYIKSWRDGLPTSSDAYYNQFMAAYNNKNATNHGQTSGIPTFGSSGGWKYAGSKTFYARWTAESYNLTIHPQGGVYNGSTANTTKTVTYGTTTNNSIGYPTRTGYVFKGWYDSELGGNQVWNASGNYVSGQYWGSTAGSWQYLRDVFSYDSASSTTNYAIGTYNGYLYAVSNKTSTSTYAYRYDGTSWTSVSGFNATNLTYKTTYSGMTPQPNSAPTTSAGTIYYANIFGRTFASRVGSYHYSPKALKDTDYDCEVYEWKVATGSTPGNWVYDVGNNNATMDIYAQWDDTSAPTASISSTNNVASSQTVTLTGTDTAGVVKYYWGTSSSPTDSQYTSVTSTTNWSTTKTVSSAGTYYLFVKDAYDNTASASATFYQTTFSVTNGTVSPTTVITKSGNSFTTPTATPSTGYSSPGKWTYNTSSQVNMGSSYTPSSSLTLSAVCSKTQCTVTLTKGTGISTVTGAGTYDYGTSVTINATPSDGYSWYRWTGSATTTTKQYTFTITSNVSFTANANINSYTLTANGNGGTIPTTSGWTVASGGATATKTLNYGATYGTLPSMSRTGYQFNGWFNAQSGGSQVTASTTMGAGNTTIWAHWTANTYTVVYNKNAPSGVSASDIKGTVDNQVHTYGSSLALRTVHYTTKGYRFAGWATSASGSVAYSPGQSVTNLTSTNGATVNLYAKWEEAVSVGLGSGETKDGVGSYTIINPTTPQTNINLLKYKKVGSTRTVLSGIKFYLNGTANNGTAYTDFSATTNSSGIATWSGLYDGTYDITEDTTSLPNGVKPTNKTWQAVVTRSGNTYSFVIKEKGGSNLPTTTVSGTTYYYIDNEGETPTNFEFVKYGSSSSEPLSGIAFNLSGKSTYNTTVNVNATSTSNGHVSFSNIPYGTYTLTETSNPSGRSKNDKGWTVTVDSTITIIDKRTNEEAEKVGGYYAFYNPTDNIPITFTKKAEDGTTLSGIQFSLTGATDGGVNVSQTATSNSNGVVTFSNIKAGTYHIDEISVTGNSKKVIRNEEGWNVKVTRDPNTYLLSYEITDAAAHPNVLLDEGTWSNEGCTYAPMSGTLTSTTTTNTTDSTAKAQLFNNGTFLQQMSPVSGSQGKINKVVYTFTKSSNMTRLRVGFNGNAADACKNFNISSLENGKSYTLTLYVDSISSDGRGNGGVIKHIKLEQGTESTDWTPLATYPLDNVLVNILEPKRPFRLIKKDTSGEIVQGAVFHIQGQSDNGTAVTANATSTAQGVVQFTDVYYGTYDLTETSAPDKYKVLDDTWSVRIDENGFTITKPNGDELEKENGDYVIVDPLYKTDVKLKKVKDTDHTYVVNGAKYELSGTADNGSSVRRTATSEEGLMTFQDIPIGTYDIIETVEPNGYLVDENVYIAVVTRNDVKVYKNEIANANLLGLSSGAYLVEETPVPQPKGKFTIKKVDEEGSPLANATFELSGFSAVNEAVKQTKTTTSTGLLTFNDIPQGEYKLTETIYPEDATTGKTYTPVVSEYQVTVDDVGTVRIYEGNQVVHTATTTDNLVFNIVNTLPPDGFSTFKIVKVDKNTKQPMSGVRFLLEGTTELGDSAAWPGKTLEDGSILYEAIQSGTYTLTETTPQNYYPNSNITVTVQGENVTFTQGGNTIQPKSTTPMLVYEIENEPYQSFKIHKVDEAKQNLEGARFTLLGSNYETSLYDVTYNGSQFNIYRAGTNTKVTDFVRIAIEEKGAVETTNGTINVSGFDVAPAVGDSCDLTVGEETYDLKVTSGTVTIKVRNGDAYSQTQTSGYNGIAEFVNIPEGNYVLMEEQQPEGFEPNDKIYTVTVTRSSVTVKDGNTTLTPTADGYEIINIEPKLDINVKKVNVSGTALQNAGFSFVGLTNTNQSVTKSGSTNSSGIVTFKDVKLGSYTITETSAPNGYKQLQEEIWVDVYSTGLGPQISVKGSNGTEFEVTTVSGVKTIVVKNYPYPPLKVKKIDSANNQPLKGAQFTAYNGTTEIKSVWVDDDGVATFEGLTDYSSVTIKETVTPEGYITTNNVYYVAINTSNASSPYTVRLNSSSGTVQTLSDLDNGKVFTVSNTKASYPLNIKKTDESNGNVLSGAKFVLTRVVEGSEEVQEGVERTTNTSGIASWTGLSAGEYTLTEIETPTNYIKQNRSYTVIVEQPANSNTAPARVYLEGVEVSTAKSGSDFYTTITNSRGYSVNIRKFITGTSTYLEGAFLNLSNNTTLEDIEDWSTEASNHTVVLPAGTYKITEETAPYGYQKSLPIVFTIASNGTVTSTTSGAVSGSTITMYDTPYKGGVSLRKTDGTSALGGATFTLTGNTKAGTPITKTAVSTSGGDVSFTDLELGNYTLVETAAPDSSYDKDNTIYNAVVYEEYGTVKYQITDPLGNEVTEVENPRNQTYSNISISKNVTGSLGDLTKNFAFTLNLNGTEANKTYTFVKNGSTNGTVTSDANGDITYNFTMKDNDTIVFQDMPDGATFTFTESANNHKASYTASTGASGANTVNNRALTTSSLTVGGGSTPGQLVTVSFTNHRDITVNTGVKNNSVNIPIMMLILLVQIVAFLKLKEKSGLRFTRRK